MTARSALLALERTPRSHLATTPTPLVHAVHLARALDRSPDAVWLKLDGHTGFALGGNKVRKLETELTPSRLDGVDTLISCGGPQSNHARVFAAAAAHLGRRCILVRNGESPDPPMGNARLQSLLTPHIVHVAERADRDPAMEEARRQVESEGGKALVVPIGASTPLGALGYARAMVELDAQLQGDVAWDPDATWIFVATSSAGTLAGMLLGASLLELEGLHLVGVSADDPADGIKARVVDLAGQAAELIGFRGELLVHRVSVTDEYVGDGYGVPTPEADAATLLLARSQGCSWIPPTPRKRRPAWWRRSAMVGYRRATGSSSGTPGARSPPPCPARCRPSGLPAPCDPGSPGARRSRSRGFARGSRGA